METYIKRGVHMKDIVIIANFSRDFSETDNGRFMYLCKELSSDNRVEIITSDFIHGKNKHEEPLKTKWPFKITFLHEAGYKKNISVQRFLSHRAWGKEVEKYLLNRDKPDVVYCAVPSLTASLAAAKYCESNNIRFVIDIQDLWPEAFKMIFNIPVLSDILFAPFKKRANEIYSRADAICGVSRTYVDRALKVNKKCSDGQVVFLGTFLRTFDDGAKGPPVVKKNTNDVWLGYCGTLSASYDIPCVIEAISHIKDQKAPVLVIIGSGPREQEFKELAAKMGVKTIFTGRLPYDKMCAQLKQCDIVVNPIVKGSAASIINKHGDYAASGLPVLNTQESQEYRDLVDTYHMGFNCKNGDAEDLMTKLVLLINDAKLRKEMGEHSRKCAEEKFDRKTSYRAIINTILA